MIKLERYKGLAPAFHVVLVTFLFNAAQAMDPEDRTYLNAIQAPAFHRPILHAHGKVLIQGKRYPISVVFSDGNMIFDGPVAAHSVTGLRRPVYLSQNQVEASDTLVTFQSGLFKGTPVMARVNDPDYPQYGSDGSGTHNKITVRTTMIHSPSDLERDDLVTHTERMWIVVESFFFERGFFSKSGQYRGLLGGALSYAAELEIDEEKFDYEKWLNGWKKRQCITFLE